MPRHFLGSILGFILAPFGSLWIPLWSYVRLPWAPGGVPLETLRSFLPSRCALIHTSAYMSRPPHGPKLGQISPRYFCNATPKPENKFRQKKVLGNCCPWAPNVFPKGTQERPQDQHDPTRHQNAPMGAPHNHPKTIEKTGVSRDS